MKTSLLLFILLSVGKLAGGQRITDTIRLDEVRVKGIVVQSDQNAGSRVTTVSQDVLRSNYTQSLSELLSENSLIYIKSMGQGGLSTSSFRGTSSNHTQINWNGVNINPVMVGSFDFSQIPTFFTDEVTLFHGNSYLKNGTGALGGSINLNNRPDWGDNKLGVRVFSEYGSNATFTEGAALRFNSGRWFFKTRGYYQQSENDFRYLNKVMKKDPYYERRKNADYSQTGVMQEIYYKPAEHTIWTANVWYQHNRQNLPQPVMVNKAPHEEQQTDNLRSYLNYSRKAGIHGYSATFSWLRDQLDYEVSYDSGYPGTDSYNVVNSYITKADYTCDLKTNVQLGGTATWRYDGVRSSDYVQDKLSRKTLSVQLNALWKPVGPLTLNLQLMGEKNDEIFMPTFSSGVRYDIVKNKLDVKASAAYNYHYPTLNDLYWVPGGNPGLAPEKGFAYDFSAHYMPQLGPVRLKFDATYYLADIEDWILWEPTNGPYWSPKNVSKVFSHGFEFQSDAACATGIVNHRITYNYGYSPSVNRTEANRGQGSYNKQLPYIPLYKWNARYSLKVKGFSFAYSAAYTDKRYVSTDKSYSTAAYTIHDSELAYTQPFYRHYTLTAKVRVNNLFDVYHESTQYYPMPLRSWYGSIEIRF